MGLLQCFIGKLDIFLLICAADKVWITELTLIHKNIRSVYDLHALVYRSIWRKTHYHVTHKNNNVYSEGFDGHYHKYPSLSYRTRYDISDNVCLDFQNCRNSIFIHDQHILLSNNFYVPCDSIADPPLNDSILLSVFCRPDTWPTALSFSNFDNIFSFIATSYFFFSCCRVGSYCW